MVTEGWGKSKVIPATPDFSSNGCRVSKKKKVKKKTPILPH